MKHTHMIPAIVLGITTLALSTSALAEGYTYTSTTHVGPIAGVVYGVGDLAAGLLSGAALTTGGVVQPMMGTVMPVTKTTITYYPEYKAPRITTYYYQHK